MLPPSASRPTNVLALLFGGALVLSLGLNSWLLAAWSNNRPDEYDRTELGATTAELHQTQRLLVRCQQQQQYQDSVLLVLRAPSIAGPVAAEQ